jgi:Rab-GTPase-TBC domain
MTPVERAAWEERQGRLCDEWTAILPAWKKKRKSARTRDLAFRGIPPSVRGRVWRKALGNPLNVPPDLFDVLRDRARDGRIEYLRFRDAIDKADGDVGGHGGRAEPLILQERSAHKAIMLDLPRTFPELAFFHADGSDYEDSLREILEAFMYLRPDIGYSQGMSFLAAVLLLYIEDAADAFACFVNMLLHKSCFLHFFRMQMPEVRIYLTMHDRFMREEMPTLHAHFKLHAVEPEMYMINWVMSLYCGALPLDLVSRIWDVYVLDGDVAIFRAALGLLKLLMPRLLSMNFEGIAYLLSHIPAQEIDGDALLRAVRGVQAVTKKSFRDTFRSCHARYRMQQPADEGEMAGSGGPTGGSQSRAGTSSTGTSPGTSSHRIGG